MAAWLRTTLCVAAYATVSFCWGAAFFYVIPSIATKTFSRVISIIVGAYAVLPALVAIVLFPWIWLKSPRCQLILIAGAPGSGKSTLAAELRSRLNAPHIDFGRLREFHLDCDWSNQSSLERKMSYENLLSMIRNYGRHGYSDVIVDDLQDDQVELISLECDELRVCILTLVLADAEELRRRIASRNDGWKDTEAAVAWNQKVIARGALTGEHKIDVTNKSPAQVLEEALSILSADQTSRRTAT